MHVISILCQDVHAVVTAGVGCLCTPFRVHGLQLLCRSLASVPHCRGDRGGGGGVGVDGWMDGMKYIKSHVPNTHRPCGTLPIRLLALVLFGTIASLLTMVAGGVVEIAYELKLTEAVLDREAGTLDVMFDAAVNMTQLSPDMFSILDSSTLSEIHLSAGEVTTQSSSSAVTFGLTDQHRRDVMLMTDPYLRIASDAILDTDGTGLEQNISHSIYTGNTFPLPFSLAVDVAFDDDGDTMFVLDDTSDKVRQYSLSAPYDIVTANSTIQFSITDTDSPGGMAFNSYGTRMYIVSTIDDKIYQYSLASPFDLSDVTFTGSYRVSLLDILPRDLVFNPFGTQMFVLGDQDNSIYEYDLSTGHNVATASFVRKVSVDSVESNPRSLAISDNGRRLFLLGPDGVHEYSLPAAFQIRRAAYTGNTFPVSPQDAFPAGLAFNDNLKKMFILGSFEDRVFEYTTDVFRTTVVDDLGPKVSSVSYDRVTGQLDVVFNEAVSKSSISANGFRILESGSSSGGITLSGRERVRVSDSNLLSFELTDQNKIYASLFTVPRLAIDRSAVEDVAGNVLATDVSSAVYTGNSLDTPSDAYHTVFDNDGDTMFIVGGSAVGQYSLSAPFEIAGATYVTQFSTANQTTSAVDVMFDSAGTTMFVISDADSSIYRYALQSPFDLAVAVLDTSDSGLAVNYALRDIAFNTDGTQLFVLNGRDILLQYELSDPFMLESHGAAVGRLDVESIDTDPSEIALNEDGTELFFVGRENMIVGQYTMTSAFDLDTAFHRDNTSSVSAQVNSPLGLELSNDAAKMFVLDEDSDAIYEYALGTFNMTVTDDTGPQFFSASLNEETGIVRITFDEPIVKSSLDAGKLFLRESGASSGGIPLSGAAYEGLEFTTLVFTLTEEDRRAVIALATPSLTIISSAAYDTFGNPAPAMTDLPISARGDTTRPHVSSAFFDEGTGLVRITFDEYVNESSLDAGKLHIRERGFSSGITLSGAPYNWFAGTTLLFVLTEEDRQEIIALATPSLAIDRAAVSDISGNLIARHTGLDMNVAEDDDGPTLTDATLDLGSGILHITFHEIVDATPSTQIDPSLVGISESGSTQNSVVLSPDNIITTGDSDRISFTLSEEGRYAVFNMSSPVLVMGASSVRDTQGGLFNAAFDVSAADQVDSFMMPGQNSTPEGLIFNNNGTKVFVADGQADRILEYSLSVPYDVSTASSVATSLSVSGLGGNPAGIAFHPNGTNIFVLDSTAHIHLYDMSVPFDLSTAAHSVSFSQLDSLSSASGLVFSPDGGRMMVVDASTKSINSYEMPVPFDVSDAARTGFILSVYAPSDVTLNADGTALYVVGTGGTVLQYWMPVPFDASSLSLIHTFSASEQGTYKGIAFGSEGNSLFVMRENLTVHEYALGRFPLSTTPDSIPPEFLTATMYEGSGILTITFSETVDVSTTSVDLSKMFLSDLGQIDQVQLTGAAVTSTGNGVTLSVALTEQQQHTVMGFGRLQLDISEFAVADVSGTRIHASTDNEVIVLGDNDGPSITGSALDEGTGILTISFDEAIDMTPSTRVNFERIHIREAGSLSGGVTLSAGELATTADSMTMSFTLTEKNRQTVIALDTPRLTVDRSAVRDTLSNLYDAEYDISSAYLAHRVSLLGTSNIMIDIALSPDGTRMFVSELIGRVNLYALYPPFEVSSATYEGYRTLPDQTSLSYFDFASRGSYILILSKYANATTFALPAPFDIRNAQFENTFPLRPTDLSANGLALSEDGRKMFVAGNVHDSIYEFNLSRLFDPSSASLAYTLYMGDRDDNLQGITFSPDGTRMFVVGDQHDRIYKYVLSLPFDLSTAVYDGRHSIASADNLFITGVAFSPDGTRMLVADRVNQNMLEYVLTTFAIGKTADAILPEFTSAVLDQGAGTLVIEFDEKIDATPASKIRLEKIFLSDVNQNNQVSLVGANMTTAGDNSVITIALTESQRQAAISLVGTEMDIGANAVIDVSGNRIVRSPDRPVTVIPDTVPPEFSSAVLDLGTGTLDITFGETVDITPASMFDLSKMFLEGTGQGSRISLAGTTITATGDSHVVTIALTELQRQAAISGDVTELDLGAGSVSDTSGNDILSSLDNPVTVVPDAVKPTLSAVALDAQSGVLNVTFSETVDITPASMLDLSKIFLGGTGQGNRISLTGATLTTTGDNFIIIIATLAESHLQSALSYGSNLVMSLNPRAVSDTSGNQNVGLSEPVTLFNINEPPDTHIDAPMLINESSSVILNGTVVDPNGDPFTYTWTVLSDVDATLTGADTLTPTLHTPVVDGDTTVTVTLDATDGIEHGVAMITITILDNLSNAPTAEIVAPLEINETTMYQLTGTIGDPNGDDLMYTWTVSSDVNATLTGTDTLTPTIHTPVVDGDATVTVTLDATDGIEHGVATVIITILDNLSNVPTADAGSEMDVNESVLVTLDGTASGDPNGDNLTYTWTQTTGPPIILDRKHSAMPQFTSPIVASDTAIVFSLVVNDGTHDSQPDTVIVTVLDNRSNTPTAEIVAPLTVGEDSEHILIGLAEDPNSDELMYTWTVSSDVNATLMDADTLTPTLHAPAVDGNATVTVTLDVADARESGTATAIITILDNLSNAPTANIVAPSTVGEAISYQLTGQISDPNGDDLMYTWMFSSDVNIMLTGTNTLTPTLRTPAVSGDATVTITLNTTDGNEYGIDTADIIIRDGTDFRPIADAGSHMEVNEGVTVTLDGTSSSDPDGGDLMYMWTQTTGPTVTISNMSSAMPVFTSPAVASDTHIVFSLTVNDGTYDSLPETVTITVLDNLSNVPVIEHIAAPETVNEGERVDISVISTDPNGDDLEYSWVVNQPSSVVLDNYNSSSVGFVAPNVSSNITAVITFLIGDGSSSIFDTVRIIILDSPNASPTTDAGFYPSVVEGSTVNLAGVALDTDPEDRLTYQWSHDGTLPITFMNSESLSTEFVAPNVSGETVVTLTLTVDDGTTTSSDTADITITDSPNSPPAVDAGSNQTAVEGSTVNLDGASSDADPEDTPTYIWTHNSTLLITVGNNSTLGTSFTAPNVSVDTAVEFTLTVSDDASSVSDKVLVTITDHPNRPPTVDAGSYPDAMEGSTVNLAGVASDIDPEDDLTYQWSHDGTLPITFMNSESLSTEFVAPNVSGETVVTLTLTVDDGTTTSSDTADITITDHPNRPPTVDAGSYPDVLEGSTVSLAGVASDIDPEDDLTYQWSHDGTLPITFMNSESLSTEFVAPNVSREITVTLTLTVNDGTTTSSDTADITITDHPNRPPTVDAGSYPDVLEGSTVSLAGVASDADPEDIPAYEWSHNSILPITFENPGSLSTEFVAPNVSVDTAVEFTLTVDDGTTTSSDTTDITITDHPNRPPTVDAGSYPDVLEGSTVSLAGVASDADPEDVPTYEWSHNSTIPITFDDSNLPIPEFRAPNVSVDTVVEFTLTVFDGTVTVFDKVLITILDSENSPPVVDAGFGPIVTEGFTVNLGGIASDVDPEDVLTHFWMHNSTLSITFEDDVLEPSFTAPNVSEDTVIEFTLTVNDGTVTISDKVLATILDSPNSPPVVNAGDDQQPAEGSTVNLDGTVTDADTEDMLDYTWSHNSTELTITFVNNKAVDTTFDAPNVPADTAVEFTLTVFDGTATVSDNVLITILDSPNSPPIVNAGDDQQPAEGSTVNLDGTVTDADTEDMLDYTWSHNSTELTITFVNNKAVDTTFDAPNVPADTAVEFTLTVFDGTATVSDNVLITILDSPNSPPIVNAGDDQQPAEGSTVNLDGTVTDADTEDMLDYTWSHNSTLSITFDSSVLDPSFTAPNVGSSTIIEFTLTVNDGTATVSDNVLITILDSPNSPPIVNAGDDQQPAEGSTVNLDGTVTDADTEDMLDYTWSHNSTLSITFDSSVLDPSFTAPNVGSSTIIEFTLTVNDGTATVSDNVLITILDSPNSPPIVNAGDDQQPAEGSTVNLDGTVTDADTEDMLDYTWSHNSTLSITFDSSVLDPSFTAPNVGSSTIIEFTLTVNDGTATVSDNVLITILDSPNSPPIVNAGDDQQPAEGSTVNLDGTVTDADTEDMLDYTWSHNSTLSITFDSSVLDPSFTAPNVGSSTIIEFTLTVNDGTATVSDNVLITILDSPNSPPIVNAGDDQQPAEGSTVNLDGTVTDADTEDMLDYTWSHNSTLSITFDSSVLDPSFTAPNVGSSTIIEFTLTVNDGTATVSDNVLITILDSPNSPPIVNAGDDQQPAEGSTVNLDGTVTDADTEDMLDYTWSHNSTELTITFVNNKAVDTTFDAPNVPADTAVEFTLTVFDGTATVSDNVLITILDSPNSPPIVNAGDDQQPAEGSTVNLDGTVTDADTEDMLDYTWSHNSTELTITFVNNKAVDTTFDAPNVPADTAVEFTLTVFDGTATVSDNVLITILDSPNSPPIVNAGDDQQPAEGSTVNLDGTVTDADTEDMLDYTWSHNSTELTITFVNNKAVDTTFDAPNVPADTAVEFTLTVFDGTATVSDNVLITILDSPNSPPIVNAGDDQQPAEGSTVNLDGTVTDADTEDMLDYTWSHNSTELTITFVNNKAVDTTFDAPNVPADTAVEFTLTVFDGTATVSDNVLITILDSPNSPPIVNAGDDQQPAEGSTVNLDGTVTDADTEDMLDYTWSHNSTELTITFVNNKAVDTTFDAPNVPADTAVEFTLTVFDGTATVSDNVLITILDSPNSPPIVNAGDDQQPAEGSTVNLDGTVTDADTEDMLDYTWSHNSTELTITFVNNKAVDTTFDAPNVPADTAVEFTLTVFDGTATVSDNVLITILDSPNSPPIVNAGDDQQPAEGSTVNLDGTVTDADTEDMLDYTWSHNSTELTITFVNNKAVDTTFDAPNVPADTAVEFTLTVFDGTATVSDNVLITILDSPNSPPIVNAGDDQQPAEGSTVNLDGTVTDADTEDMLDYTWSHNSTELTITFVNNKAVDTTFDAPNVPADTAVEFTLTVFDGTATVSDNVLITILDSPNSPPIVNAGDDQQPAEGSTVNLDGTVTDADTEDMLDYTWSHNSTELTITFVNNKAVDTTFDAPNVPADTAVEFTLTVFDGTATVSDNVLITILDSPNSPPIVNAGDDQQPAEGSTVNLDGTVTDADTEDMLDYTWSHNSTELTITFVNNKAVDTTFDAPNVPADTAVEFTLTVFDGTATVSDNVLITILDSPNSPPIVNAGDDQQPAEGSTVNLDGTVTDADTEDMLDYTWSHNSTELTITFVNNKAVDTTFDAPNVPADTAVEFTLTVFDGTATVSDNVLITILDSPNSPPIVNAGDDQQPAEGSTVNLDGTVTDADTEDMLDYTWSHNSTELTITFVNNKAVDTTFDAPNVPADTAVEFTLTVFDGTATVSDNVLITILDSPNSPPIVNAGDDQQPAEGSTVNLDGTVTDADTEDMLDYTWSHNSTELTITFVNNKAVDTTFDAPNVPADTAVEFTLTVFDGTATVSDNVLITILDSPNSPPIVNAGDDQQPAEGSTVNLDGTVTDADTEDMLDYTWSHNSTELTITFVNNKAVDTTFDAPNVPADTAVEFTLTVFDGTATVSDNVLITILDSPNSPPIVNAGDDQQPAEGSTVNLDGTVTDADTEDMLDYTWSHNSTELTITFVNNKAVDTTFDAPNVPADTAVEFTLTVFDGTATVSDNVLITILDSPNSPPIVNAGDDQQPAEGSTVNLDGTVTDADTEDMLDYTWSHNSTELTITFVNNKAVDTTFDAPNVPADTAVEFTLTVFDGTATVSDNVLITILDSPNSPPIVNAGDDQQPAEGSTVSLNGTVTDTDVEDMLDYTWSHNSTELTITFVNNKAVDTTFDAPNVPADTAVEFTLTVFDGTATVSDNVLITILDSPNSPPIVNAGDDQQPAEGSTVSLNGTVTDTDVEDMLDYTWSHNSTELTITFVNNKAVDTTFDAPNVPADTAVEFTLTVFDGTATVSDNVLITILDSPNSPPIVNAGDDQQPAEGSTVSLNGTVTDTDVEDMLDYTWSHNSTELTITFVNNKAVDTTFDAPNVPADTAVEFTLTVFDGTATVSDNVLITILDSPNSPPIVNAGDDQQPAEGSTVNL